MSKQQEIEIEKLDKALDAVVKSVRADFLQLDYQQVLVDFIPEIQKGEMGQFAGECDAEGAAWRPLAASTIRRKGHDQILSETGRLAESLVGNSGDTIKSATPRELTYGTAVPYSIFHVTGTGFLPIRDHVGIGVHTLNKLVDVVADATVDGLTKGK